MWLTCGEHAVFFPKDSLSWGVKTICVGATGRKFFAGWVVLATSWSAGRVDVGAELCRFMALYTHTHFQIHGLEKGVSENEAPGPVGAYTTTHNDTTTLMPNLIHRTEILMSRARFAEGLPAGCATLRHNRTHALTGPRKARTYMRI